MFCYKCGKENSNQSKFCCFCGSNLNDFSAKQQNFSENIDCLELEKCHTNELSKNRCSSCNTEDTCDGNKNSYKSYIWCFIILVVVVCLNFCPKILFFFLDNENGMINFTIYDVFILALAFVGILLYAIKKL